MILDYNQIDIKRRDLYGYVRRSTFKHPNHLQTNVNDQPPTRRGFQSPNAKI